MLLRWRWLVVVYEEFWARRRGKTTIAGGTWLRLGGVCVYDGVYVLGPWRASFVLGSPARSHAPSHWTAEQCP